MRLYHGSTVIVERPRLIAPNRTLDFGIGFYTTMNRSQAVECAGIIMPRRKEKTQFVSVYEFDMERAERALSVLRFSGPDDAWLDFVCENRQGNYAGKAYDMIIGPIANDKVYATIGLYESGILAKEQAIEAFKINPLYDQVVMKTEAALALLQFCEAFDPREGSRHDG